MPEGTPLSRGIATGVSLGVEGIGLVADFIMRAAGAGASGGGWGGARAREGIVKQGHHRERGITANPWQPNPVVTYCSFLDATALS